MASTKQTGDVKMQMKLCAKARVLELYLASLKCKRDTIVLRWPSRSVGLLLFLNSMEITIWFQQFSTKELFICIKHVEINNITMKCCRRIELYVKWLESASDLAKAIALRKTTPALGIVFSCHWSLINSHEYFKDVFMDL